MKSIFESHTFYKRFHNRTMNGKSLITVAIVAMLLSLTSCGNLPAPDENGKDTSGTGNRLESVDIAPSADTDVLSSENTTEDKDTSMNKDSAIEDDSWKIKFEKSLLDNYGVKPVHYEELETGVYQVYVEIDGKVVPYVVVNSATGDYHG